VADALAVFGLTSLPNDRDLKAVYRDLMVRNHPDKIAATNTALRIFAEERTKEISAAYKLLSDRVGGDAASSDPLQLPAASDAQDPRWDLQYAVPAVLTAAGVAVVFVAFHVVSRDWPAPPPPVLPTTSATPAPAAEVQRPTFPDRVLRRCTVRAVPSVEGKAVESLGKDAQVRILEQQHGWRHVATQGANEGWVGPSCWRPKDEASRDASRTGSGESTDTPSREADQRATPESAQRVPNSDVLDPYR